MRGAHAGDVFTISLHQHNNYPAFKPPSSIDVDLPDGTGDDDYLAWLDNALSSGLRQFEPDLLCYIAGADPYREDQLGGLSLTIEGLKKRDELVFRVARARDIPVMVTYAGGYARNCRGHGDDSLQHGHRGEGSICGEGLTRSACIGALSRTDDILDGMNVSPSNLSHSELYGLILNSVAPRPIAWVSTVSAFRTAESGSVFVFQLCLR